MAAASTQSQSARSYGNINAGSTAARTVTSTTSTTTTTRNNGYYGSGSGYYGGAPAYGRPGYSGGTVAAAAVGGALVGHALSNHGNTTIINNGGVAPAYGYNDGGAYVGGGVPVAAVAPVAPVMMVSHQSGILTFLEVILAIVVLFAVVAFLIRLFNSSTADAIYDAPADFRSSTTTTRRTTTTTTVDPEEERAINKAKQLLAGGAQFYRSLQDANNRGDKARLSQMLTNDIYPAIAAEIDNRDGAAANTVVRELRIVGEEVLAFRSEGDTFFGSLHFKGKVSENGGADEDFDEVHHFKSEGINGPWKLEGIQPFGG
jgi:predicted lipid-binding transport protein (Tim44 family)